MSEDELKDYYNTFEKANSEIYNKFKNGEIERVDADGDGVFTYADLTLISLFETNCPRNRTRNIFRQDLLKICFLFL